MYSIAYIKEKWAHAGFQKYLRNTGWMFFGKFFTLGISFFVGAYIARYLGPANYGLMNYVISFVGLFGFLASFGIDGIVSREIIKDHSRKDELIGTSFFIKLIGAVITITAISITAFFTTSDKFTLILILLFSLSYIPQAFNIIETYFQSQVLSKNVVRAQIIATIVSTTLKLFVIFLNKGIFWLTIIYIIETTIYALILLLNYGKFENHIRSCKFSKIVAKSLLSDSWPLMLSTIAVDIYMKIDQVMIKNMLGNEQAGVYAAATKIAEAWYFIPVLICTSIFPAIVNSIKNNTGLFEQRIKKLYSTLFWVSICVASLITFFSDHIIMTLFGSAYIEAITVLRIYVWAGISASIGVVIGQYTLIKNYTEISFYRSLIGTILNIALNFLFIPTLGIKGAAIATLISYTSATLSIVLFKKTRNQMTIIIRSIFNLKH